MPGRVVRVEVEPGQKVSGGQVLLVLEAMKMEHTIRSPRDGVVSEVDCAPGDQVEAGAVLVIVRDVSSTQG
jgi:propionyl-CoA carboxylase alpha chain